MADMMFGQKPTDWNEKYFGPVEVGKQITHLLEYHRATPKHLISFIRSKSKETSVKEEVFQSSLKITQVKLRPAPTAKPQTIVEKNRVVSPGVVSGVAVQEKLELNVQAIPVVSPKKPLDKPIPSSSTQKAKKVEQEKKDTTSKKVSTNTNTKNDGFGKAVALNGLNRKMTVASTGGSVIANKTPELLKRRQVFEDLSEEPTVDLPLDEPKPVELKKKDVVQKKKISAVPIKQQKSSKIEIEFVEKETLEPIQEEIDVPVASHDEVEVVLDVALELTPPDRDEVILEMEDTEGERIEPEEIPLETADRKVREPSEVRFRTDYVSHRDANVILAAPFGRDVHVELELTMKDVLAGHDSRENVVKEILKKTKENRSRFAKKTINKTVFERQPEKRIDDGKRKDPYEAHEDNKRKKFKLEGID